MQGTTYEQPLNERIRTLLRLEFLFRQADHTLESDSPWDSRATIADLIEILNVFSRGDLKTEIIKELERLAGTLSRLENNPEVDQGKLGDILAQTESLVDRLYLQQGQIGQELRDNEFLNAIKQRTAIPGGTCDFDLPAYHHWLQRPAAERSTALRRWFASFDNYRAAIDLIMGLVRESAATSRETATSGFYQQSLDTSMPYQIIRVTLPEGSPYFAEISGGKHRFTVRMMELRSFERPAQTGNDVDFVLGCCAI